MNWNGQRETLDHLIRRRLNPGQADKLQAEFNAKRRSRIESALTTRPYFVPLSYSLNAAGQVSPYRDMTPQLPFDFLITGIKTDSQTREIVIRRTEDEKPIVYVGENLNLFLRLDEIGGLTADSGGGQLGVFYLPQPIALSRGNRLSVEVYKTDTTADPESVNIVLVGVRVFNSDYAKLVLEGDERGRIDFIVRAREIPRIVFLKQLVEFDAPGVGGEARNLFTPEVDEPLLVRGMRTTLRRSSIEMRLEGEPEWTNGLTPIWGIAAEDELVHDNYQWFSKPVYLRSKASIEVTRVRNSIDGVNVDAQTGNSITWICETV